MVWKTTSKEKSQKTKQITNIHKMFSTKEKFNVLILHAIYHLNCISLTTTTIRNSVHLFELSSFVSSFLPYKKHTCMHVQPKRRKTSPSQNHIDFVFDIFFKIPYQVKDVSNNNNMCILMSIFSNFQLKKAV